MPQNSQDSAQRDNQQIQDDNQTSGESVVAGQTSGDNQQPISDTDAPNQAANKEQAEGSRDTVNAGGQILAVQTNNATFDVAEASQQLAMVRLRAVEHGRDALMASTVGVSGFVDAHGRVYGATSFFTPAVIVRELRIDDGRTLATRLGAGPEYVIILGALAALVAAVLIRPARGPDRKQSRRAMAKTTKTTKEGP